MANDRICIFFGQKLGLFNNTTIPCANTWQPACNEKSIWRKSNEI